MKYFREEKILEVEQTYETKGNLVFVSGCFDVIHLGHIYFFREAMKNISDAKLLVAVHDDESIREHKGENRPVNNIDSRVEVLSELVIVDYIVKWTGWENISDFVKNLKPKYIAVTKGEYEGKTLEKVSEEIESELIVVPKFQDYSSSGFISKIGF